MKITDVKPVTEQYEQSSVKLFEVAAFQFDASVEHLLNGLATDAGFHLSHDELERAHVDIVATTEDYLNDPGMGYSEDDAGAVYYDVAKQCFTK